jgi:hypothetical protein
VIEDIIKEELAANPGSPGLYYPFKLPLDPDSKLAKLVKLKTKKA